MKKQKISYDKTEIENLMRSNINTIIYLMIMSSIYLMLFITNKLSSSKNVCNMLLDIAEVCLHRELDRVVWINRFAGFWLADKVIIFSLILFLLYFLYLSYSSGNSLNSWFEKARNNRKITESVLATIVFALSTSAFAFLNPSYIHDFGMIFVTSEDLNLSSDRWFASFIFPRMVGNVLNPWFSGIISILCLCVSVVCIVYALNISKRLSLWLVAGICTTNISIILHSAFTGGGFIGSMALMFVCIASVLYERRYFNERSLNILLSALFIMLSAATYGSYVGVFCVIVIIKIFDFILNNCKSKTVIKYILQSILTMLLGVSMHYIVYLLFIRKSSPIDVTNYMGKGNLNSLSNYSGILSIIPNAYKMIINYYLGKSIDQANILGLIILPIFVIGILLIILYVIDHRKCIEDKFINSLIFIITSISLPIVLNLIYLMAIHRPHLLMVFVYNTPFLGLIKLTESHNIYGNFIAKIYVVLSDLLVFALIAYFFVHICFANAFYTHINNMYQVSLSIGTRIIDRIESLDDFNGREKINIIGFINSDEYYNDSITSDIALLDIYFIGGPPGWGNNGFSYKGTESMMLKQSLGYNMEIEQYYTLNDFVENNLEIDDETVNIIRDMDYFPRSNGITKIGNNIYIKFKDWEGYR